MKGQVRRRAGTRHDLVTIYRHYAEVSGILTVERFLEAPEAAYRLLAGHPGLGTSFDSELPALAGRRVTSVSPQFKAYLVFYRTAAAGIEVVRVLHGGRDAPGLLAAESGDEDAG